MPPRDQLSSGEVPPLNTQRLRLRRPATQDAGFVLELLNSPGWQAYIGDRGVRDEPAARAYVSEVLLPPFAQHGFGLWVSELRDSAEPVGLSGLVRREDLDHPDLGFALLPAWEGQGLAREASEAVCAWAAGAGIPTLLAITTPDNEPSRRLLERLGFRWRQRIQRAESELDLYQRGGPASAL